jgi:hypothetical protein
MKGHVAGSGTKAVGAVGAKTAAASSTTKSLVAKLLFMGLVVGGGTTAVVTHTPSKDAAPVASVAVAPQPIATVARPQANEALPPQVETPVATEPAAPEAPVADPSTAASADEPKLTTPHARHAAQRANAAARSRRDRAAHVVAAAPQQAPPSVPSPQSPATSVVAPEVAEVPRAIATPDPQQAQPSVPETAAPSRSVDSPAVNTSKPATPEPSTPKHQLAPELALVRAASVALRAGDPSKALASLRKHSEQFPHGALRVEADALRAMALCAGNDPAAASARDGFLRAHPSSALAERVRAACAKR